MCVIAVSEAGQPVPSKDQLKLMWDKNPHGAGIVVDLGGGQVYYRKGLMTIDQFNDALDEISHKHNLVDQACAFHFRIKTSGKTDGPTTHPFILSPRYQDLRRLEYTGSTPVMMHNGVISKFGGWLDKLSSDTQDFAATIGFSMLRKSKKGRKPSNSMLKAAESVVNSSRVVVFYGDNKPVKIGDWKEAQGLCVSNTLWVPSTTTDSSQSTYKNPAPDTFGMWTDQWPIRDREWIKYSSKTELEAKTKHLTSLIRDGKQYVVPPMLSGAGIDHYYLIDGLEIYTKKGKEMRDAREAYFDNLLKKEDNDEVLGENDYFDFADADEFWRYLQQLEYDEAQQCYLNADREPLYVDFLSYEGYTEEALRMLFDKNYRYAKRDLAMNGTITTDWTEPSQEEKQNLTAQVFKSRKEANSEKRLIKALSC